jgi:hypothetical protein
MNYIKRVKEIMKLTDKNGDELSYDLGMSHSYFRKSVAKNVSVTALWVRCFVVGFNMGRKSVKKEEETK